MKGYITNEWDRDNLMFLLHASKDTLDDWNRQADADDLVYAQELLAAYSEELRLRSMELRIEAEMGCNYPDANMVIDKIKK